MGDPRCGISDAVARVTEKADAVQDAEQIRAMSS